MGRKIGEIFEHEGEWYQCLPETHLCYGCAFKNKKCTDIKGVRGECQSASRKEDGVIFKKLEKVGEPMKIHNRIVLKVKADAYMCMRCCFYSKAKCELTIQECKRYDCGEGTKFIEIKQTKEDMEEKNKAEGLPLLRLVGKYMNSLIDYTTFEKAVKELYSDKEGHKPTSKEFNLEAAKAGKPVCTRDGRKARIICFDRAGFRPIIALVNHKDSDLEYLQDYIENGRKDKEGIGNCDLMMLPEKKEGWVNVYKDGLLDTKSYPTKKEAFDKASPKDYVDTIKISWEE